jgi:predicted nucleic-acid-binding Zn-ribbon protein
MCHDVIDDQSGSVQPRPPLRPGELKCPLWCLKLQKIICSLRWHKNVLLSGHSINKIIIHTINLYFHVVCPGSSCTYSAFHSTPLLSAVTGPVEIGPIPMGTTASTGGSKPRLYSQ